VNNSINLYKDITIGVLYFAGLLGLMSGEILISLALIGTASLMSNFYFH
jgi:hypothetical protein